MLTLSLIATPCPSPQIVVLVTLGNANHIHTRRLKGRRWRKGFVSWLHDIARRRQAQGHPPHHQRMTLRYNSGIWGVNNIYNIFERIVRALRRTSSSSFSSSSSSFSSSFSSSSSSFSSYISSSTIKRPTHIHPSLAP